MKTWFKNCLRKQILVLIKKLRRLERKIIGFSNSELKYSALSPIGNSSDNQHYSDALDWALKNRSIKDIKNIALTGPYGSGKSTILKTYHKNYMGKDLKFLFISLATFKEESIEPQEPSIDLQDSANAVFSEKNQLLRLIETSILQQIFYHENDDKIPDSRFKKIRSFGFWQLLGYSFIYSLFIISVYVYLKPEFIPSIFRDLKIEGAVLTWIHYLSVVVILLGFFGIIFSSIRVIRSVTLQKLNFQNAEIGIGVNQNKSILNHHIDEILYFFSVRPYNVVVIEDLDRFKQTEIFTKLREINLLLNTSNKTKRKDIVFIYAVRDEMFTDKERTKFFDFIIPVIPIINSSNSAKILMAKRNEFQYQLSDELIEDLSYYIDDMRLLHNITNEFYLYKKLLDQNLTQDKLFAIITYKNIQPQQFVLLSGNSGKIYDLIYSKRIEIESRTAKLNKKISDIKSEIKRLDDLYIVNVNELRLLYLACLFPKLKNLKNFLFEGNEIKTENLIRDENFEHLENDELEYQYYVNRNYQEQIHSRAVGINFEELENLVDKNKTYRQRVEEIENLKTNKAKIFRSKIQEIEKEKELLRNLPIAQIMQQNAVQIHPGEEIALEDILVRNGYIAEDYIDYISLFHDGDISRTDYQFMLNLKNGRILDMDYKLQKTERVLSKISPLTFHTHLVLNFDLVDQLFKNPAVQEERLKRLIDVLKDESDISIKFITEYLKRTHYLKRFIKMLSSAWPNIWCFFENLPEIDESQKEQIFQWLIIHLDNSEILKLSQHYDMTKKIANDPLFPEVISDQNKMRDLLKILNIKFHDLDISATNSETLKYIFINEHYEINPTIVKKMMRQYGKYDQHIFETKNYSSILNSESSELTSYVDKNINLYVQAIFLVLDKNIADEEETVILLLNNSTLIIEWKEKIIANMNKKIISLANIRNKDVIKLLFKHNKVLASWDNLRYDFLKNSQEISAEVISFLNGEDNADIISQTKIPSEGDYKEDYSALSKKLALTISFSDEVFKKIAKSISTWFKELDLSSHSYKQVEILINTLVISPLKVNFDYLKEEFNPLHLNLFERLPAYMVKVIDELELDSEDIERLLASENIVVSHKVKILEHFDESLITSNPNSLMKVVELSNKHEEFIISESLLDATLLSKKSSSYDRIKLLVARKVADKLFLRSFISSLEDDYLKINDTSKRPKFPVTEVNRRFLQILQDKGMISSFSKQKDEFKVYHKTK